MESFHLERTFPWKGRRESSIRLISRIKVSDWIGYKSTILYHTVAKRMHVHPDIEKGLAKNFLPNPVSTLD